jgi:hypothetical protein
MRRHGGQKASFRCSQMLSLPAEKPDSRIAAGPFVSEVQKGPQDYDDNYAD